MRARDAVVCFLRLPRASRSHDGAARHSGSSGGSALYALLCPPPTGDAWGEIAKSLPGRSEASIAAQWSSSRHAAASSTGAAAASLDVVDSLLAVAAVGGAGVGLGVGGVNGAEAGGREGAGAGGGGGAGVGGAGAGGGGAGSKRKAGAATKGGAVDSGAAAVRRRANQVRREGSFYKVFPAQRPLPTLPPLPPVPMAGLGGAGGLFPFAPLLGGMPAAGLGSLAGPLPRGMLPMGMGLLPPPPAAVVSSALASQLWKGRGSAARVIVSVLCLSDEPIMAGRLHSEPSRLGAGWAPVLRLGGAGAAALSPASGSGGIVIAQTSPAEAGAGKAEPVMHHTEGTNAAPPLTANYGKAGGAS